MDAPSGPSDAAVRYRPYRKVWAWLFMAWFICYLDRSITGPVVSWMIANDVGFLADVPMQHAMAGIVGSMFFAGYMLTQFPAGYLGDRYGHRTMVVISTAWAGIATLLSGLSRSLFGFVAMRVLTGLGEGAYYSNDRAIINEVTPKEEKGFAMGVVFVGLALGLTVATLVTVPIIELAVPYIGSESAWTVPFVLFSIPTMLISYGLWRRLEARKAEKGSFLKAATRLVLISAVLLVVVMATFEGTLRLGWGGLEQAAAILLTALGLVAIIYWRLKVVSAPVLRSRNLWLMYLSALPILYTLWFFGFWALLLVSESAEMGLPSAAVYASLFGVAGLIGYPLGGRLGDRAMRVGWGRRRTYVGLCLAVGVLVLVLALVVRSGEFDVLLLGTLLFVIGVLFAAMQTVHMTLTSDLAPEDMQGQAFGMWNLVAEIGAILAPVVSGTLRDMSGSWTTAIVVTGALLLSSAVLVFMVRGAPKGVAEQ